MKDQDRSKAQLISELIELRRRIGELEQCRDHLEELVEQRSTELDERIVQRVGAENTYRTLLERSLQALFIVQDNHIVFANQGIADLSGYTHQELLAFSPEDWRTIVHPEDRAWIERNLQDYLTGRPAPLRQELRFVREDGEVRWVEALVSHVDYHGKPAVQIASIDITERKQAEAALREQTHALRESEELLNNILTASSIGIAHARDRNIVWGNEAMVRLFGFTEEGQYLGKDTQILYASEEEYKRVGRIIYEQRRAGKLVELDAKFKHQDGSLFDGYMRVNTLDPLDPIRGIIVSVIDITDRKQAEEERSRLLVQIQEQARQVQQIVDTVPEGVLLLDASGRVALANPVAERDLSVLAGAKVGDTLTHLGDRQLAELLTSPPKGLWHEVQAIAPHEQGGRTFEVIARPIENGSEPQDWVLVINDVTRERDIQQRAQQQERLAAVGQLAAGIAHDFNNIMATIVLYAQMTSRMRELPATVRERMDTIYQQAQHAARLIQQILDFSRRAVLERRPLDLLPLVKEQVKLLERTLPEHIEIELIHGPDEDAAPLLVNADPTRMQQMMTNLALNARDAMSGGGKLRIGLEQIEIRPGEPPPLPEMGAGAWARLTVSDTGMGISPDILPHIFEPFFTTRAPLGSGLGLAQVYGIVGQHEGKIDVETLLGAGTTFTIYLPIVSLPEKPLATSSKDSLSLSSERGQTILVVEDDPIVRKALLESLKLLHYQALEAANGQEALAMLEQRGDEIDLLLSDVVMPGMGGVALLRALKEKRLTVRIVMLTGHPLKRELEELRAQGMIDWLPKPPKLEQLAQVVARALDREGVENG
jgi:two-component system cell cycle sensor histidine kinase/response regulator CckA